MMQLRTHARVGVKDAAGQPAMTVVHRKQKTRHNNDRSKKSGFTETFAYSFRGCNRCWPVYKCKDAGWRMTRLGK
jgi:hypothetical protein